MIKFDLEKALAGEKVVTRDGREVTQLHVFNCGDDVEYNVYGVVGCGVEDFSVKGKWAHGENELDLFMAPKKLSGFVNVYKQGACDVIFGTKEAADEHHTRNRVACIDLSQFEEGHGI